MGEMDAVILNAKAEIKRSQELKDKMWAEKLTLDLEAAAAKRELADDAYTSGHGDEEEVRRVAMKLTREQTDAMHSGLTSHIRGMMESQWYTDPYNHYVATQQQTGSQPLGLARWIAAVLQDVTRVDEEMTAQQTAPTPKYPENMNPGMPGDESEDEEAMNTQGSTQGAGAGKGIPTREQRQNSEEPPAGGQRMRSRSPIRDTPGSN